MEVALVCFIASTIVLLLLSTLYIYEDTQGHRVFLISLRSLLDRSLAALFGWTVRIVGSVWRWLVRFVLRYGVYRFLSIVVSYLKYWEQQVEDIVLRNRRQVRKERTTRTHLDDIAEHKQSVALTEKEKRRLRNK